MATISTPALSATNLTARLGIVVDPYDYFDFTNQKQKSGVFTITINSISWTGSDLSDQTLRVDGRVPNYDEASDSPVVNNALWADLSSGSSMSPDLAEYHMAWNVGVPGPQAVMMADGQVQFLDFAFALDPATTASGVVVTIDYTVAFTQKVFDYTDTPGNTVTLAVSDFKPKDWVYIVPSAADVGSVKAATVQLHTISGTHTDSVDGRMPYFSMVNVPAGTGGSAILATHGLPAISAFSRKYPDGGFVFAINDGKVDANGITNRTVNASTETDRYSLFVVSLGKQDGGVPGTTSVDVAYTLDTIA